MLSKKKSAIKLQKEQTKLGQKLSLQKHVDESKKIYGQLQNENRDLGRQKRNALDPLTQREIKCEPLWSGTAGYWVYTQEVPNYCFSKSYDVDFLN